jgi:esterase/lipase
MAPNLNWPRYFISVAIVLSVLAALVFFGPRTSIDIAPRIIQLPVDIQGYVTTAEARFVDIREGTAKKIIWAAGKVNQRTPLALVYLHGFSATRQEVAPLCKRLASSLGANLFYTRFTGHGRPGRAMSAVTVSDLANDALEALAIGRRLGDRPIIIGTSTGGTLATWLASQDHSRSIHAVILLSPNFGPRNPMAEVLNWPWARFYVPLIQGRTRRWEPTNDLHARYWTTQYPTEALFSMMGAVRLARSLDLERIDLPFLFIYSPNDQVVDSDKTDKVFARLGGSHKSRRLIFSSGDPAQHVIAGEILSPQTTDAVLSTILTFLDELQQKKM